MQTPLESSRLRWADLIRALGAFLVALAHVQYTGGGSGVVRDFYYALTRAAVPLFFMASGYLLLSKNESYFDFFRKRAVKVFFPFLVWSVIYLLWKKEGFGESFSTIAQSYFYKIIRGPRESHLWFFYELFGLYLFTPILRVYLQNVERKDLYYFLGAWFLLMPVAIFAQEFTPLKIGFTYYFLGGYIGYFLFGYAIQPLKISRRAAWTLFFINLAIAVGGMYLNRVHAWKTQYFEDYMSVHVVLMSCALFAALKDLPISDALYRWIAPLSRASFGIYLAHVIVMTEVFSAPPFSLLPEIGSNFYMIPALGVLGFGLTFLLIFILQKIPLLKYIVP